MTHTPPKADLSPEGLRKLAERLDSIPYTATTEAADILRALADPPPADGAGLETTEEERDRWFKGHQGAVLTADTFFVTSVPFTARLARDFNRLLPEHARAEGLAKEVERLKADNVVLQEISDEKDDLETSVEELTAKLAVYEAPVGDGEVEAAEDCLIGMRTAFGAGSFAGGNCSMVIALLRRLSAINAQREGEKADLLGHMRRIRDAAFSGTLTPGLCAEIVTEALGSRAGLAAGEAGTT